MNESYDEKIDLTEFNEDYRIAKVEEFKIIPDGEYSVFVHKVKLTRTREKKKPMLAWQLKIIDGEYEGCIIYKNIVIKTEPRADKLKCFGSIKGDLLKFNIELDNFSNLEENLESLLDQQIGVEVKTKGTFTNVYFRDFAEKHSKNINEDPRNFNDIPF